MSDSIQVGLVGTGARGRLLLKQLYRIRNQDHFLCEKGHYGSFPLQEYDLYGKRTPEWVDDISDINPSISVLFDPSEEALREAESLCQDHSDSPETYDNLEEFVDSDDYDAVIITSPNDTHVDIATRLLEKNTDIFCEKPLATTLGGHDDLIDAERKSGGRFFVGFNLRSSPKFAQFERLISEGHIGELGMISMQNVREPLPRGFRYSDERSGGALLEKNCHDFDLFNWFAKSDPKRVMALGGTHILSENTDVNDHATVLVEYENGVKATLELCLYAPFSHEGHRSCSLRGSDGIALSNLNSSSIEVYKYDDIVEYSPGERSRKLGGHDGADIYQLKRFFEFLQGKAERPATILDAKKAAAVSLAAERAIDGDGMVSITSDYELE